MRVVQWSGRGAFSRQVNAGVAPLAYGLKALGSRELPRVTLAPNKSPQLRGPMVVQNTLSFAFALAPFQGGRNGYTLSLANLCQHSSASSNLSRTATILPAQTPRALDTNVSTTDEGESKTFPKFQGLHRFSYPAPNATAATLQSLGSALGFSSLCSGGTSSRLYL